MAYLTGVHKQHATAAAADATPAPTPGPTADGPGQSTADTASQGGTTSVALIVGISIAVIVLGAIGLGKLDTIVVSGNRQAVPRANLVAGVFGTNCFGECGNRAKEAGELCRNDELCCPTIADLFKCRQVLDGEHVVIGFCFLDAGEACFCSEAFTLADQFEPDLVRLRTKPNCFGLALRVKDRGLLAPGCREHRGLLFAVGTSNSGFLVALRLGDRCTTIALSAHLRVHC